MTILQANGLEKIFITNTIFTNINFSINAGDRVGLVGPNGAGKSTLMKCIAGLEELDAGTLSFAKGATFGYLAQQVNLDLDKTIREAILEAFEDILDLYHEIRAMEEDISAETDAKRQEALLHEYQHKQERYEAMNGYAVESQVKGIVLGLGFKEEDLERRVESFSGGERTRIMLARQLARNPELLLLDEPTNHLDLPAIEWLEGFLKNYKGTLLVISHDEYFLEAVVTHVYDLENKGLTVYPMGFFKYKEEKKTQRALQHKHFLEQQKMIAKEEEYIRRNRAGVNSKQARGREKKLMRQTFISDVTDTANMKLATYEASESARFVLTVQDVQVEVQGKVLAKNINFDIQAHEKVSIIGRNGIGKSTLLKALLKGIEEQDSHVKLGNRVHYAYFDQHQMCLDESLTVLEQTLKSCDLKLSEAKTLLARYLFREDDLERSISLLSGGEKVRLSFMILLFTEPNFLILDEPTNHLDMESKEIVISFLQEFQGAILVVSHDRELLNSVCDRTMEMTSEGLTSYLGNYQYYKEKKELLLLLSQKEEEKKIEAKAPQPKKKKTSLSKSKLKVEVEKLEKKIMELEATIEELNDSLNKPGINYSDLARNLDESNQALEDVMLEWQEKSELLEEAMAGE